MAKEISKSKAVAQKTIYAAFKILKEAGGEMSGREILDRIRDTVQFNEFEKERLEKTGYVRWESIFHFYSIDSIKAGFIRKNKGIWTLTDEGEKAIALGPEKLIETASIEYRKWKENQDINKKSEPKSEPEETQSQEIQLSKYESEALEGIRKHLNNVNAYDFQDMVAALLRAMGYYTPHIAARGKDGGIDIIAYSDPLGTKEPRIKVQVKHRPEAAISVDEIRQLNGLLSRSGDVGLFVTSGKFTNEAERAARELHNHIELINFQRFITLWQEYYEKFSDEVKNWLPLQAIYFLGTNQ
jgi:restriction system protein